MYSPDLNVTLKKISDNLILTELQDGESNLKEGTILTPVCSPLVDLSKPEILYGLAERIVAVESLIFLSKQYQFLQEYLEYLVPQTNRIMLQQFFAQVRHFYWLLLKYLLVCGNFYFGIIFMNIFWSVVKKLKFKKHFENYNISGTICNKTRQKEMKIIKVPEHKKLKKHAFLS